MINTSTGSYGGLASPYLVGRAALSWGIGDFVRLNFLPCSRYDTSSQIVHQQNIYYLSNRSNRSMTS